jgi:hypothetical protein
LLSVLGKLPSRFGYRLVGSASAAWFFVGFVIAFLVMGERPPSTKESPLLPTSRIGVTGLCAATSRHRWSPAITC